MNNIYQVIREMNRKNRDQEIKVKLKFFLLVEKLGSVSLASDRRGLSRSYYYKWWRRFKKSGYKISSLKERSRRPKRNPGKIPKEIEKHILGLARHGNRCRMIQGYLNRGGIKVSHSTINHVLHNRSKVRPKKRKRINPHRRRYELPIPGQRLQMDVKYLPYRIMGEKVYVYVIIDECTRWRFAKGYPELNEHMTEKFLEEVIKHVPFPIRCIQTDNGQEFTYKLFGHKTEIKHKVDEWCDKHGIKHRLIPAGEKELNGKVERSHRIDMQYFYWRSPKKSLEIFNHALIKWIHRYNFDRPHGGIGYMTPMEKLEERINFLKWRPQDKKIEYFRLMFLKEAPMLLTKEGRFLRDIDLIIKQSRYVA